MLVLLFFQSTIASFRDHLFSEKNGKISEKSRQSHALCICIYTVTFMLLFLSSVFDLSCDIDIFFLLFYSKKTVYGFLLTKISLVDYLSHHRSNEEIIRAEKRPG